MSFSGKVKNGGWGAVFLWIYVLAILLWHDIGPGFHQLTVLSSAVPSLVVMFTVEQSIDFLNDWWAGGNLQRSSEIAYQITGSDRPYEVLDAEAQSRIDKFDDNSYGKQVTIITGVLIGLSLPFVGFNSFGFLGFVGGGLLAGIVVWFQSYRSVQDLKALAAGMTDVYKHKHEN